MKSKLSICTKTASVVSALALLTLAACDGSFTGGGDNQPIGKDACASTTTSAGVKLALFRKAREGNPSAETRISNLEQGSVARLEQPVVDQVDGGVEKTTCSATLVLSLPPGSKADKGLEEQQKVRIRYSIQPSADGNGDVYEVFGGEELAASLGGRRPASAKVAQAATPAAETKKAGLYYIRGLNPKGDNWLALKPEPNLQSRRIAQLGPDTLLMSDGTRIGQWLKVETLDGRYGWVASRYTACCR